MRIRHKSVCLVKQAVLKLQSHKFRLVKISRVRPREDLVTIAIPDATPEVIRAYALDDEQALLAAFRRCDREFAPGCD